MKKLFGILVIAICAFGFMPDENIDLGNTELSSVITVQDADAECVNTAINNGRCSFSGMCFVDASDPSPSCDSTRGGGGRPTTPLPGGGGGGN